MSLLASVLV